MKTYQALAIILCSLSLSLQAQNTISSFNTETTQYLTSYQPETTIKGSPFLYSNYHSGVVRFINSSEIYQAEQIRYHVLDGYLEIVIKGQIVHFDEIDVATLQLDVDGKKQHYVNAKFYKINGVEMSGLFQVIEKGKLELLKQVKAWIETTIYDPTLRDNSNFVVQEASYFLATGSRVHKLKNKQSLYRFFADRGVNARYVAKNHKLSLNREKDKKWLVKAYNQYMYQQDKAVSLFYSDERD